MALQEGEEAHPCSGAWRTTAVLLAEIPNERLHRGGTYRLPEV